MNSVWCSWSFRSSLVAFAWAACAWAAPVRIGTNKEDECAPRHLAPAAGADVALVRALGFAFEPVPPEVRVQAIEDLGLLGDARALNALALLCLDPHPFVARAAVRAIAAMRSARAEEILTNVVKHPALPDATRTRALELLPYQNTWSALRFIHTTAALPHPSAAVGQLAARLASQLPRPPDWVPPPLPPPTTRRAR